MKFSKSVFGLSCALGLAISATSAQAAGDEPDKFSGFYAGLVSGYATAETDFNQTGGAVNGPRNIDLDGGHAGITAGYNGRYDKFLFGFEGDATTLGLDDTASCDDGAGTCTLDIDALVTVRGRIGYVFGEEEQFLVFATGGLANTWWGARSTNGPAGSNIEATELGFTVGGGFGAYLMDTNWMSVKVEYLYVDMDVKRSYDISGSTRIGNFKLDGLHLVRAGWNVHF
ncbi:MAG: porin family protein [Alphaproteobacteria bacterium]|nr:porin family protein [Alphaproteobacteria bacterium]